MLYRLNYPLSLILIMSAGCGHNSSNSDQRTSAIPVLTAGAVKSEVSADISLSGNIEGARTLRLGFMVAGKIDFIAAEEGGNVLKDKLLASLDTTNYSIARDLAEIQVKQVRDEYDRLKIMHDNKSLSESDFAKITFGLQQAEAQLRLHKKNLSDTKLYSPVDGVLLKKLAEAGEITGTGIPILVVSDIHKVKVNAFIPENELHNIRQGQIAVVNIPALGKTVSGKIVEIGSAADPASRSFSIKVEIANPGMLLRPGMIAEVSITSDNREDVLTVPASAILHDFDSRSYVFIADTAVMRAFKRIVSPGKVDYKNVAVTAGLREGELVITGGQNRLVDGSEITISK